MPIDARTKSSSSPMTNAWSSASWMRSATCSDVLGVRDALDQHGELVAAQARGGVRPAQALVEARGGQAQQLVADLVAERVVDGLEVVEVDEQHRDALAAAARVGQRVADAVLEERAVRQAR